MFAKLTALVSSGPTFPYTLGEAFGAADNYFARPRSGVSDALVDDTITQILQPPLPVQTACLTTALSTDLTPDLPDVDVPVLMVHGDADASAPLEITGRPTAAVLPKSRLLVYPGAPHGLYVTDAERLNADLLDFLAPHSVP